MFAYSPRLPDIPVTAWTGTLPPHSLPRTTLTPRPGFHQAGPGWTLSRAEPDLHTALGQSCQPREAKCSFHHTRPHPQAGSQPFVWKKKGLLVLTSSSPPLPAHLPPYTPLPAFQLLFKASTDQLRLQQGRQDPPPLRLCFPPPTQTRAPGARSAYAGAAPTQSSSSPSPADSCDSQAWGVVFPLGYCGPFQHSSPQHNFPKI